MTTNFNIITDPTSIADAVRERYIAYEIGSELKKHYPGRLWMVNVSLEAGIVDIVCPSISAQYGYSIHLNQAVIDMRRKGVIGGGEILERFGLSRDRKADDDIQKLAKDNLGFTKGLKHGGV